MYTDRDHSMSGSFERLDTLVNTICEDILDW